MSMKIHLLSDLHVDFSPFDIPKTNADLIVIAGDVSNETLKTIEWLDKQSFIHKNKDIIFVPGNHDYYDDDVIKATNDYIDAFENTLNVIVLQNNNYIVSKHDVFIEFIGATLWSNFSLYGDGYISRLIAQKNINDFRKIKYNGEKFTPQHATKLSCDSFNYIRERIVQNNHYKKVVVTHFLPHELSIHPAYKGDMLNPYYCRDCSSIIGEENVTWLHGHTHNSFDYMVDKTRIVCNPRGYVYNGNVENTHFNPQLVINI